MATRTGALPMPTAVWLILVMALLDMMSMGIIMPVLPILIEDLTGSAESAGLWTGIIGSLWAVTQFFCAPFIGALSDRFGRRPVLLLSAAGLTLSWILMALAPSLTLLVAARVIGGMTSASGAAIFAYVADVMPSEGRTRAFGLAGAAISAGFVIGPAVGGALGEWGARFPFWVAAGFSAATFLYGLLILPESLSPDRRSPFSWRSANPAGSLRLIASQTELARLAGSYFLLSFGHRIYTTVFVLYAAHRYGLGLMELGALLAIVGGLDLLIQGVLTGRLAARFGDRAVMIFGFGYGTIGLACMALAPTAELFAAGLLVNSLWGLSEPTVRSLMSARVSEAEQGQLQGAMHSVMSASAMTGPLFFGWIYGLSLHSLPGLTFAIGAAVMLAAAALSYGKSGRSVSR